MKINRLFSIAAAALMMVACSSEDTALKNTPAAGPQMQFTATIAAPNSGATTRTEYTEVTTGEAAGTISVAWKVGDEIALIHNGVKDVATVKTINADGSATITGDITVGTNGEDVIAYYPAAAIELNNDKNPVSAAAYTEKMLAQDGTLSYIASNLDLRVGESTLAVDGDKATLSDNVKLASQIAIWKLTLQDNAETPAALSATQVSVIKDGETPETLASTATLSTATSTVYLAMPPMSESEATVAIKAATAAGTYIYENSGLTLAAGNYYQSTVTMAPAATDFSGLTDNYTAQDGETLTGTLDANVKISIAAGATVTLDGVTINGVDYWEYEWAGITCAGDATIILKDGTTNTVQGFDNNYPGIFVPENCTLTIKGTGSLTASCSNADEFGNGAGIGGIGSDEGSSCGNIVIEGGTINAMGRTGIGACYNGPCGDITIKGGNVTATGRDGAGIGTCYQGKCGNITISGGTVTATAKEGSAAGIGSGSDGTCGNISISGGTVEATGKDGGAGIGSGDGGTCGDITITTGVTQVTATKGDNEESKSIGAGHNGTCGTVTIGGKTGAITQSPYIYPEPTIGDVGNPIGFDGGGDPLANN